MTVLLPTMTMSSPNSNNTPKTPVPASRRWSTRGLNWLLLLLILGPFVAAQAPLEIGRWHIARSIELRDRGEKERAYAQLDEALQRFPGSPSLLLQRAAWRLEDGQQKEGLDDCEMALEFSPEQVEVLRAHSQIMHYVGRHTDAVEDCKRIDRISLRTGRPPRSMALNELAYAQALAERELEEAAKNVSEALKLRPSDPLEALAAEVAYRDTRGYLRYVAANSLPERFRTPQYKAALEDLNYAVNKMGRPTGASQSAPSERHRLLFAPPLVPHSHDEGRDAAVIRYHRALVLLALGKEQEAENDLTIVRKLIGGEPDERLF